VKKEWQSTPSLAPLVLGEVTWGGCPFSVKDGAVSEGYNTSFRFNYAASSFPIEYCVVAAFCRTHTHTNAEWARGSHSYARVVVLQVPQWQTGPPGVGG
jgi:hypothetical protein